MMSSYSFVFQNTYLVETKASEIAGYFQKEESYFKRKYLSCMIAEKKTKIYVS